MREYRNLPITTSISEYMDVEKAYTEENYNLLVDYFLNPKDTRTATEKREQLPEEIREVLAALRAKSNEFIQHLVGVLGQINPIMLTSELVDVDKTINPKNFADIVYKDTVYSVNHIISIFKLIRTLNWSDYNDTTQVKSVLYNSGVPLLLYAQRLYNNIPYSAWMEANPNTYATILGKPFQVMPKAGTAPTDFPIQDLRVKMVSGKKGGQPHVYGFNSHKSNKTGDTTFDMLPELYRMMLGQLWIYTAECRNTGMILDWNNWDNVPESFDQPMDIKGKQGTFRVKKNIQHGTVF